MTENPENQADDRHDDETPDVSFRGHGSFSPLLWWVALIALTLFALQYRSAETARQEVASWSDFKNLLVADAIKPGSVSIRHDRVEAVVKAQYQPDKTLSISKEADQEAPIFVAIDSENRQMFIEQLDDLTIPYRLETSVSPWGNILLSWLPMIL